MFWECGEDDLVAMRRLLGPLHVVGQITMVGTNLASRVLSPLVTDTWGRQGITVADEAERDRLEQVRKVTRLLRDIGVFEASAPATETGRK